MKQLILIACALLIAVACKKKKDDDPEPETPATPVYQISIKIDGAEKHCNSCYSGSKSGGIRGSYFYLDGFNEQLYFSCTTLPAVGTHTLLKYGNPYLMYSKNNVYYRASVGTMTITAIDTSAAGVVNKLHASFAFQTDTSSNVSYTISEGSINLN